MKHFTGKTFRKSKVIKSLRDYIELVEEAKIILKSDEIWYRGLANRSYKLNPNIYRISYSKNLEMDLTNSFRDKAKGFINWRDLSSYDWYFLMQHFGLKTRLLDWTEGSLIALFFALKLNADDNEHENPSVWIINPLKLNELTFGKPVLIRTEKVPSNVNYNTAEQFLNFDFKGKKIGPIAISSSYTNERIIRQKGCFTFHGNLQKDIVSIYRQKRCNEIIEINIDGKSRNKIIQELLTTGISESTIFPDLEGLSREINFKYIKHTK